MKELITIKKPIAITIIAILVFLSLCVIALTGTTFNLMYQNGKAIININGQNAYAYFSKRDDAKEQTIHLEYEKRERQVSFTKEKVKGMEFMADLTFRKQLIDKGVKGNIFENDTYKAYTHIRYIAFSEAIEKAIKRYRNDFRAFIREGKYDYKLIELEFEKYLNNGVLDNSLDDVRIVIRREWLSNMCITSAENFEYMESIAPQMFSQIKEVYVGAMQIELEYEKMIYEKEQELKAFIQLLEG